MAKEFTWSDSYSVGIPEIDEQHKALFELIDRLHRAIVARQGSAACAEILKELVDYTRIHFALEQSLMHMGGYPDYDGHCLLHKNLVAEVETLQEKIDSGTAAISFELLHFLRNWLTKHILGEDMKYAAFFQKSGHKQFDHWAQKSEQALRSHKRKWWKFW